MASNEMKAHRADEVDRTKVTGDQQTVTKWQQDVGWNAPTRDNAGRNTPVDVEQVYGSVQDYQKSEAARQREELHLPPNASAAEVYKATAQSMVDAFHHAGPKMRGLAMREFGLHESEYNAENLARVLINRDKRGMRFTGNNLDDLESAKYARQYQQMKDGDYDSSYD